MLLFGSSIAGNDNDWTTWNTYLTNSDGLKPGGINSGMSVRRSYNSGPLPVSFAASNASMDATADVLSLWSCKEPIDDINSGSRDVAFMNFFNSIPTGHLFYGMMWHEPWDNFTEDQWPAYKAAQARVWNILQDSNADTNIVKWGILGTSYDFQQNRAQTRYFPSGGEYDFVGADGYDFYRAPGLPSDPRGRDSYRSPSQIFGACVDFAATVGKPVVVGEFAFHPDPDNPAESDSYLSRPARMQAMMDWFNANNIVVASYFHSWHGDSGPWWADCFHNFTYRESRSATDLDSVIKFRDLLTLYGKVAD